MAKEGKGGGARKYGRNKRGPANGRYRHKAAKKRRIVRLLQRFPRYRAPGWKLREGYGLVEDDS